MGDHKAATLAKAKKELEELYLGVPDDSVNLTFQDLAQVIEKKKTLSPSNTNVSTMEKSQSSSSLAKLPSIDFNKSIQAASFQSSGTNNNHNYSHHQMINNHHNDNMPHNHHRPEEGGELWPGPRGGPHHAYGGHDDHHHQHHGHGHASSHHHNDHGHRAGAGSSLHVVGGGDHHDQRSMHVYDDDMSHVSGMSVAYGGLERGGRRRPGIPHSNICTVCSSYIYICRHRCLVCGRVYCRQCVSIGMGEMTEGRKCVECLGRRFSQRYIHKAGNTGWCMGYRSAMKQQELKWAEKGPRKSGENRYRGGGGNNSVMTTASRSRSPVGPATPRSPRNIMNTPNSFVMSSPYSPYSPANNHHPMPF